MTFYNMQKLRDFLHWHLCRLILRVVSRNSLCLERGPLGSWKISVRGVSQKPIASDMQVRGTAGSGLDGIADQFIPRERIHGNVFGKGPGMHSGA